MRLLAQRHTCRTMIFIPGKYFCRYDRFRDAFVFETNLINQGPRNTVYEGGTWVINVVFPKDYPFKPPKVTFYTSIYHCNISEQVRIFACFFFSYHHANLVTGIRMFGYSERPMVSRTLHSQNHVFPIWFVDRS